MVNDDDDDDDDDDLEIHIYFLPILNFEIDMGSTPVIFYYILYGLLQ
jgi:hypothetical protein